MKATFLGTSAGKPSLHRNTTSIAIELDDSKYILIDCGEATLHQIMRSNLKMSNLHSIYITHLHGDHIFGLPGLLCSLNDCRDIDLNIYGPKGIKDFISVVKKSITNFTLNINEYSQSVVNVNQFNITINTYIIKACRVRHTVECYAYQIIKQRKKPKINTEKLTPILEIYATQIKKQGFKSAKNIMKSLIEGTKYNFTNPASGNVFELNITDYYISVPDFKIVIALDNYNCDQMKMEFQNANILIHESTFCITNDMLKNEKDELTKKAISFGHSTNLMAAINANDLFCKHLILTHFSNRYEFDNNKLKLEDKIINSTSQLFPNKIDLAYDFSEFKL